METPVCSICNATRYRLVNLIPLLDLNLKRVAEVVVCIGASDPPSERDRLDAPTPAARLKQVPRAGLPGMTVTLVDHPVHDDEAWRSAMIEIIEARPGGPIVMNPTGGTKRMSSAPPARADRGARRGAPAARRARAGWRAPLPQPCRADRPGPLPSWQRRKLLKSAPRPFLDGATVQQIAAECWGRQAWAASAFALS